MMKKGRTVSRQTGHLQLGRNREIEASISKQKVYEGIKKSTNENTDMKGAREGPMLQKHKKRSESDQHDSPIQSRGFELALSGKSRNVDSQKDDEVDQYLNDNFGYVDVHPLPQPKTLKVHPNPLLSKAIECE